MLERDEIRIIPASALQHYLFCPTQCALIHHQKEWEENLDTAKGNSLHLKTHTPHETKRGTNIQSQGVNLIHPELGISCQPDRIDWDNGIPSPFEAKKGKKKKDNSDTVQLCCAALCLEYLLDIKVNKGRIYYWGEKKSYAVVFDTDLRKETIETIEKVRTILTETLIPTGHLKKGCARCSLKYICLPK